LILGIYLYKEQNELKKVRIVVKMIDKIEKNMPEVGLERLRSWNCHDISAQKSVKTETITYDLLDDPGTDFTSVK